MTFIIIIGIAGLILTAHSTKNMLRDKFSTEEPKSGLYGYVFYWNIREFCAGVLMLVISLGSLIEKVTSISGNKIIGSFSFFFSILFGILAFSVYFSTRTSNLLWKHLIHGKDHKLDQVHAIWGFAIASFFFLFGFYLFYWGP